MPKKHRAREWVEIDLELAPYLIQYASGGDRELVLKKCESDLLFDAVALRLRVPQAGWKPRRIPPERRLVLKIPASFVAKNALGRHVSEEGKAYLAKLVETTFWKELYYFVAEARAEGEKELHAVKEFRTMHGISEDLYKLDSMLKRYRRTKQRRRPQPKTRDWRGLHV